MSEHESAATTGKPAAKVAGIDRTHISSLEHARINATHMTLYRLVLALDIDPRDLFPAWTPKKKKKTPQTA